MCDKIYMHTWRRSEEGKRQTQHDSVVFYLTKSWYNSACRVSVSHSLKWRTILWGFTKVRMNLLFLRDAAHTGRIFSEFPLDVLAH